MISLFLALGALSPRSCLEPPLRLATFNIENFPKNDRQVEGAFSLMRSLQVDLIGVQEIGDPERFRAEGKNRLGPDWDFVSIDTTPLGGELLGDKRLGEAARTGQSLGLLYDSRVYTVRSMRARDETRTGSGRHKPVLEVQLAPTDRRGPLLRVFVLHLKSSSAGREIRREQLVGLAEILDEAVGRGERVVVMGDFNATEERDREEIDALAEQHGLVWATESLACSAYWQRDDGCPTSRLDHVLTFEKPSHVEAAAACADSCERSDRCPTYWSVVSDHCPIVVSFE